MKKIKEINRNGSIIIIILFLITFLFLSATTLLQTTSVQYLLTKYSQDSVQAKYIAEDIFNNIYYNEDIFYDLFEEPILKNIRDSFAQNNSKTFILNKYKDLNKYFRNGTYEFFDLDKKRILSLNMHIKYKESQQLVKSYISVLNPILELEKSLITPDLLDEENRVHFHKTLDKLFYESFDYEAKATNSIYIHNLQKNARIIKRPDRESNELYKLKETSKEKLREFSSHVLVLNMMGWNGEKLDLVIGDENDKRLIKVNGSIYVEGNLIINQGFEFNGIIVVNNGQIVNNSEKPTIINGLVLYNGEKELNMDKFIFNYDKKNIGKYGSYIPGFIEPEITMFKLLPK